jgi:hypothetical protein
MTASAGVAAAADEGLAAAVRGEPAGAQAAILIVCREAGAREMLRRELSKRYAADYEIVICARPAELAPWMRDLRAGGLPVALVIGGVGAQDRDGVEVLAAVRGIDRRRFGWPRSAGVTGRRCGRSSTRSLWARSTTG